MRHGEFPSLFFWVALALGAETLIYTQQPKKIEEIWPGFGFSLLFFFLNKGRFREIGRGGGGEWGDVIWKDEGTVLTDRRGRPLLHWKWDAKSVVKVPLGSAVEVSARLWRKDPEQAGRIASHLTANTQARTHTHTHTHERCRPNPININVFDTHAQYFQTQSNVYGISSGERRAQIFKWKQQNNGNIKSYLKVKYVRFLV